MEAPQATRCEVVASRSLSPEQLVLGEEIEVELDVTVNCPSENLPRQFMLVVAPRSEVHGAHAVQRVLRAFLDAAPLGPSSVGMVLGHAPQPVVIGPTTDRTALEAGINSYGPTRLGSPLSALLQEGRRRLLTSAPRGRQHIILIDHGENPPSANADLANELLQVRYLAQWLTHVCTGGHCRDLARSEVIQAPDEPTLETTLRALAVRPARLSPDQIKVTDAFAGQSQYVFASARPAPTTMGETIEIDGQKVKGRGFIEWSRDSEQTRFAASYRIRPTSVGEVTTHERLTIEVVDTLAQWGRYALTGAQASVAPPPRQPSRCEIRGQAVAGPSPVLLGSAVPVTVTLAYECPGPRQQADVVLVIDRSLSTADKHLDLFLDAARAFLDQVDFPEARVGIVTYADEPELRQDLTSERAALHRALEGITAEGNTNPRDAVHMARNMLAARRPNALPLIVLMYDGNLGLDPTPAVEWSRMVGIRIATVCSGGECSRELASSSQFDVRLHDQEALAQFWARLADALSAHALDWISVTHVPNAAFLHGAQQVDPDPPISLSDGSLQWRRETLLGRQASLAYRLTAWGTGRWPIANRLEVQWGETEGGAGSARLEVPELEVELPPPEGPCTPRDLRRAVAPRQVEVGEPFTVTTHVDLVCPPDEAPLHIAFVIDHSSSMGFSDRLRYAKEAVSAFLGQVSGQWMFGLVAFNDAVTFEVPLTESRQQILDALDRLDPDGQTNISAAIDRAHELLNEARPGPSQPEVPAFIVLLTDGRNNAGFDSVSRAAARAQADGIQIVAVCVGDCDPQLPTAASAASLFFDIPDPAMLVQLFEQLARNLVRSLGTLDVEDKIGQHLEIGASDPSPPAQIGPEGLWWYFDVLPVGGVTLTHQLRGLVPGRHPVSLSTRAYYSTRTDLGSFFMAVPAVEILGPTTPESPLPTLPPLPTATPEPGPSATATVTATPARGHLAYLPLAYRAETEETNGEGR